MVLVLDLTDFMDIVVSIKKVRNLLSFRKIALMAACRRLHCYFVSTADGRQ